MKHGASQVSVMSNACLGLAHLGQRLVGNESGVTDVLQLPEITAWHSANKEYMALLSCSRCLSSGRQHVQA